MIPKSPAHRSSFTRTNSARFYPSSSDFQRRWVIDYIRQFNLPLLISFNLHNQIVNEFNLVCEDVQERIKSSRNAHILQLDEAHDRIEVFYDRYSSQYPIFYDYLGFCYCKPGHSYDFSIQYQDDPSQVAKFKLEVLELPHNYDPETCLGYGLSWKGAQFANELELIHYYER